MVDAGDQRQRGAAAKGQIGGKLYGVGGWQLQRCVRGEIIQVEEKRLRVVALQKREGGVGLHIDAEAVIFAPRRGNGGASQIEVGEILVDLAGEVIVEAMGLRHKALALGFGDYDAFNGIGFLVGKVG